MSAGQSGVPPFIGVEHTRNLLASQSPSQMARNGISRVFSVQSSDLGISSMQLWSTMRPFSFFFLSTWQIWGKGTKHSVGHHFLWEGLSLLSPSGSATVKRVENTRVLKGWVLGGDIPDQQYPEYPRDQPLRQ